MGVVFKPIGVLCSRGLFIPKIPLVEFSAGITPRGFYIIIASHKGRRTHKRTVFRIARVGPTFCIVKVGHTVDVSRHGCRIGSIVVITSQRLIVFRIISVFVCYGLIVI